MALRNLRRARTLSQADLARHVGIGQHYLSKIENGLVVPSLDVQDLIAAVLGVARKDLFPLPRAAKPARTTEKPAA
jgi:transcriptional regulator with XRE-family HTH domain